MLSLAVGLAGLASVVLHVLLGPGRLLCCSYGALGDWFFPVLGGLAVGAPLALAAGPSRPAEDRAGGEGCPACGAVVRAGWRLCPRCGNILGGDGT